MGSASIRDKESFQSCILWCCTIQSNAELRRGKLTGHAIFSRSFSFTIMSAKDSRQVFAENPRRYLLKTIENNPKLLINFANRVNNMLPFTLEAFGVLMERGCFVVTQDGRLKTIPNKVRKSVIGTEESISCQRVARYIGKNLPVLQIALRCTRPLEYAHEN
jgi:hypothetical protein